MKRSVLLLLVFTLSSYAQTLKQAPRFDTTDLDGKSVVLDSLLSRGPVYVAFWATWCKPCMRELDELGPIYEKYRDRGFQVVAINQDAPRSLHRVKPVVRGRHWKFSVLLDPEKALARAFQVISLPTSFLIDTSGEIVKARQGFKPGMEKMIEEEVKQLFGGDEEKQDSETEEKKPES